MRILAINLQVPQEPSCAEAFLGISRLIKFRSPCYVFVGLDSIETEKNTINLEEKILERALTIAKTIDASATVAIADTAPRAQMLTEFRHSMITKKGFDYEVVNTLPIQSLLSLEGLEPWANRSDIHHVISFFQMLGIHRVQEVMHFKLASFRERWGHIGVQLWNRLHQKELQEIKPLEVREPFCDSVYFDAPLSLISDLILNISPSLQQLCQRMEGRQRLAQKVHIVLFCEHLEIQRFVSITPPLVTRNFVTILELLLRQLEEISFENPIRRFEIEIEDVSEPIEASERSCSPVVTRTRWQQLVQFAHPSQQEYNFT